MLDIRLDFITNIKPEYVETMKNIRLAIITLDKEMQSIPGESNDSAGLRSLALARTNLEQACQHAIKALCIFGENK